MIPWLLINVENYKKFLYFLSIKQISELITLFENGYDVRCTIYRN